MEKIELTDELSQNFIDFSYEANSQRAFADARDGLKPGQRACLWEMYDKGYTSNKPHVKSAKISGGVIANWWPHGDVAIYDTFARMSQPWINNIPEVDWHGANGSQIISGEAAASRYTEARLSKATEDGMLFNIKKHNIPMIKNFSEDAEWPEVLPAILPRLMINGCQGIGVTIANLWLPHSFSDLSDVILKYLDTGNLDISNLYPDFPSGGEIINKDDIHTIYETGRGKVILRGTTEIENNSIFITSFPYQVYIEPWIDSVKKLIENDSITKINEIYNRSSNKKILVEIECESNPEEVLSQLFQYTDLQKSFNANQYALVSKTPKLLNLKEYLDIYINHNLDCIKREKEFDLAKAEDRWEIVNGLLKALVHIDDIILLIKKSDSAAAAKDNLIAKYDFTERQAKAIVDMKLGRLAHLEAIELNKEFDELTNTIADCKDIIAHVDKRKSIFRDRFTSLVKKYSSPRRTKVINIDPQKSNNIISAEDVVVIMSKGGNIKRIPKKSFRVQNRNGKGIKTADDVILSTISTDTTDTLFLFSNNGKMYKLSVNDVPVGTNLSKGVNISSLIKIDSNEYISAITSNNTADKKYVVFFTKNGLIKKTDFNEYKNLKKSTGVQAIKLKENDEIVNVDFLDDEEVIIITNGGRGIRFETSDITPIGRYTGGCKSISLKEGDSVLGSIVRLTNMDYLAIFTREGNGKRIKINDLPLQKRGGVGVILTKEVPVSIVPVNDKSTLLAIGMAKSICISADQIPINAKEATGVKIIKNDKLQKVTIL